MVHCIGSLEASLVDYPIIMSGMVVNDEVINTELHAYDVKTDIFIAK